MFTTIPTGFTKPTKPNHRAAVAWHAAATALALTVVLGGLLLPHAGMAATPSARPAALVQTLLRCEVVYQPTQAVWVREVLLTSSGKQLQTVGIDGVAVHTFGLSGSVVLTAQDNERIQIDLSQPAWTSDFRGLASGKGLCTLLP